MIDNVYRDEGGNITCNSTKEVKFIDSLVVKEDIINLLDCKRMMNGFKAVWSVPCESNKLSGITCEELGYDRALIQVNEYIPTQALKLLRDEEDVLLNMAPFNTVGNFGRIVSTEELRDLIRSADFYYLKNILTGRIDTISVFKPTPTIDKFKVEMGEVFEIESNIMIEVVEYIKAYKITPFRENMGFHKLVPTPSREIDLAMSKDKERIFTDINTIEEFIKDLCVSRGKTNDIEVFQLKMEDNYIMKYSGMIERKSRLYLQKEE